MAVTQRITLNDNADIRVVDSNFQALDRELDSVKDKLTSALSITIPADDTTNYTTLTDKDGVDYYNIQIPVTGMTADYVGTQPLTPKMKDPAEPTNFSIAEWEEIRDSYFPMIMACFGRAGGYVDVYLYDLPDKDFDVYLYGV